MPLNLNKKILWMIVIWFAVLQAISPFIHVHVGVDSSTQSDGFHMHIASVNQANDVAHTLKNLPSPTITIGLDNGVARILSQLLPVFFVALVTLLLFLAQLRFSHRDFSTFSKQPAVVRPQSRPRAPPIS